jgi:IS30 family transposase
MEHTNLTKASRMGKHLNFIEGMSRVGAPTRDIAAAVGRSVRTIQRELRRGRVKHRDSEYRDKWVYSAEYAQAAYEKNATAKGYDLKLGANYQLAEWIAEQIKKGLSPDVVAARLKGEEQFPSLCTKTIYTYIDMGLIPGVTNESLWEKRKRKRRARRQVRASKKIEQRRVSIRERPDAIDGREELGHWEIDLVVGPKNGSKTVLLTLVERKSRQQITRRLKERSQRSVLRAINGIERLYGAEMFRRTFKSITADNGSEFLAVRAMEKSVCSEKKRTQMYYADPYCSWQRGTNENTNRFIRRFISKGMDIAKITKKRLEEITQWINNYPRRILEYMTPAEVFTAFANT